MRYCDLGSKRLVISIASLALAMGNPCLAGDATLWEAAAAGDLQTLQRLIDGKADVNARDGQTRTPLIVAVQNDRIDAAKLLMDNDANPRHRAVERGADGRYEYTALVVAADRGNLPMIELLLHYGAGVFWKGEHDLNVFDKDEGDLEALHRDRATYDYGDILLATEHAVIKKHREVVERLMQAIHEVRRMDRQSPWVEQIPLIRAAFEGDPSRVREALLSSQDIPMWQLSLALRVSRQEGNLEAEAVLAPAAKRQARKEIRKIRLNEAMSEAVNNSMFYPDKRDAYVERAIVLLRLGADANYRGQYSHEPYLCTAADAGSDRLVAKLLDAGADVNARDFSKRTAVSRAAEKGHSSVVQLLVAHGADIQTLKGSGALAYAASQGDPTTIRKLLELNQDPNEAGKDGSTPLMAAAASRKTEAIKLLLEAGANVNAMNRGGATALMMAENEFYDEVMTQLRAAGAEERPNVLPSPLASAAAGGSLDRVRFLLSKGIDPNAQGPGSWEHREPILAAFENHRWATANLLLDTVGKPGGLRIDGLPILPEAAKHGDDSDENIAIVRRLLSMGVSVDQTFEDGWTALMFSAIMHRPNLLRFLLDQHANTNLKNSDGQTALDVAIQANHTEIAAMLRRAGGTH